MSYLLVAVAVAAWAYAAWLWRCRIVGHKWLRDHENVFRASRRECMRCDRREYRCDAGWRKF